MPKLARGITSLPSKLNNGPKKLECLQPNFKPSVMQVLLGSLVNYNENEVLKRSTLALPTNTRLDEKNFEEEKYQTETEKALQH